MNKIYVICPALVTTGGAELLHQLVYKLNTIKNGIAIPLYKGYSGNQHPTPDIYIKYTNGNYVTSIKDHPENYIIIPEIRTHLINTFRKTNKIIWWLSVDNFIGSIYKTNQKEYERINQLPLLKKVYTKLLRRVGIIKKFNPYSQKYLYNDGIKLHTYQSEFAREFLKDNKLDPVLPLSDYLNSTFISNADKKTEKENIILYNPVKGFEVTQHLIKNFPEYRWIALQGFTPEQMNEMLKKSKIYIDFGNHPGKDRIPREAAINDCIVITNTVGAANNNIDIPIESKYKFKNVIENQYEFKNLVDDIFENYNGHHKKFLKYRDKIKNEENIFDEEVLDLYHFIQNTI